MNTVAASCDMIDDHFRKHLELRHIPEGNFADLKQFRPGKHFTDLRPTFETYHKRLHETQEFGHEHV